MNLWDEEYRRRGMPSSFRSEPSGVIRWVLHNWNFLTASPFPSNVVDVGTGTGRNALFMAECGAKVIAFDSSEEAIEIARERIKDEPPVEYPVTFLVHDLAAGIPAGSDEIDLVTDVFVYKHQLELRVRKQYLAEVKRVLNSEGRLLLSLAGLDDGYYRGCPDIVPPVSGNPRTITDPVVGVGSVLYDLQSLVEEMSDVFTLELLWHKRKMGTMHGGEYLRSTMATVWRPV